MKKGKTLIGLASLMLLAGASTAAATCRAEGKISRLRAGVDGNFVDVVPEEALPSYTTFFDVPSDRFFTLLASAQAASRTVTVTGKALFCQTGGQFRNGGTVIGVDIYTFR